jgi:hypothetical protein
MVESWVDFISNMGNAWRKSTSENMVGTFLEHGENTTFPKSLKQYSPKSKIIGLL